MVRKFASRPLKNSTVHRVSKERRELGFRDVVIRRKDPIGLLRKQLLKRGEPRFPDPETGACCFRAPSLMWRRTWSSFVKRRTPATSSFRTPTGRFDCCPRANLLYRLIADSLISDKYRDRLIFGFSTGTLDDKIAPPHWACICWPRMGVMPGARTRLRSRKEWSRVAWIGGQD